MFTETYSSKYFITFISYIQSYDVLLFSLSKLSQLQDFDVGMNELKAKSISVIGEMTSLIKLNLRSCGLSEVPQWYVKKVI